VTVLTQVTGCTRLYVQRRKQVVKIRGHPRWDIAGLFKSFIIMRVFHEVFHEPARPDWLSMWRGSRVLV
jgi:hypothetical protein